MEKKVLNEMFENLLHIGNKTNYWNSKMKDYIYGSVNGIHVINLVDTSKQLESIKSEVTKLASEGKKILFVATKLQARDAFATLASETGNFYVTEKWVPGLLTNFKTIRKRIATYLKLLKDDANNAFDVLPKKEKASKLLELSKLDKAFKGLKEMKKVPDVIFVVDGAFEAQAVREANSLRLPVYAILNTNGDPDKVTGFVTANTNSVKSIDYLSASFKDVLSKVKVSAQKSVPKKLTDRKRVVKANVVKKEETKKIEKTKTKAKEETKKTTIKKSETKKEEK